MTCLQDAWEAEDDRKRVSVIDRKTFSKEATASSGMNPTSQTTPTSKYLWIYFNKLRNKTLYNLGKRHLHISLRWQWHHCCPISVILLSRSSHFHKHEILGGRCAVTCCSVLTLQYCASYEDNKTNNNNIFRSSVELLPINTNTPFVCSHKYSNLFMTGCKGTAGSPLSHKSYFPLAQWTMVYVYMLAYCCTPFHDAVWHWMTHLDMN